MFWKMIVVYKIRIYKSMNNDIYQVYSLVNSLNFFFVRKDNEIVRVVEQGEWEVLGKGKF